MRHAIAIRGAVSRVAAMSDRVAVSGQPVVRDATQVWSAMIFCILSSQVRAETAANIGRSILSSISFFSEWPTYSALLRRIKDVMTENGINHRFPNSKAEQIASSWFSFVQIRECIGDFLSSGEISEIDKRDFFCQNFAGFGMKQSSMLLRDLGAAKGLAIIDSQILYYLRSAYDFDPKYLSKRNYILAEEILKREADNFGVELSEYDVWVWNAVRHIRSREDA